MEESAKVFEEIISNLDYLEKISNAVIIVIALNLVVNIIRFYFEKNLKDRDKHIHRKNLITEKSIKTQEIIYIKLDELTLFDSDECHEMLEKIQEIQKLKTTHALFIDKKMNEIIESLLDYFLSVCSDYRKRDISKELELFNKYVKCFNK